MFCSGLKRDAKGFGILSAEMCFVKLYKTLHYIDISAMRGFAADISFGLRRIRSFSPLR